MKGSRTRLWSLESEIIKLYNETELTIQEITDKVEGTFKHTWNVIQRNFSEEKRKARKTKCYSNSKTGIKNPQFGKKEEDTANWKGGIRTRKDGYITVVKPEWWTTRESYGHIFLHHYIYCIENNMTSIPKGFVVHHIDEDITNNTIENLQMLSLSEHMKLHAELRKVQRLPKAQKIEQQSFWK